MTGSKEVKDGKAYAFLGVFLSIVGFIIVLLAKKENKYAMYYATQGLVLFIAYMIGWIVTAVIGWIPIIGWIVTAVIWIFLFIVWLIGWINALSGVKKPLPVIGKFAKNFKF